MAYLVNQTNGTLLATVLDGAVDRTHAGIALIGKQVSNYGEIQNENFVRIAENFSNSISPIQPLEGQIWWNSTANTMQVFDGASWRPLTGFTSSTTAPTTPYIGDQWWDITNQQYYVYTGTAWTLVGPAYSILDGKSGAIVENVWDTSLTKHTIIKIYHNNSVTGIISRDVTFTPNVAIPGFTTVQTGMSFASTVADIKYHGTATNSELLGNLTPTQFIRSDIDQVSSGRLSIQNDVDMGPGNILTVHFTGANATITNNSGGDINIKVGATSALAIDGTTGLITIAGVPTISSGIVNKHYADTLDSTLRTDIDTFITANVATVNASIAALATVVNNDITAIYTDLAPKASPILTGIPAVPTAAFGTNTEQIASTAFVHDAIAAIDPTTIYKDNSSVKADTNSVTVKVNSMTVATATTNGIITTTQAADTNSTLVATTEYVDRASRNFVLNSVAYRPTCYVSSSAPNNAVGNDGDMWYQYV